MKKLLTIILFLLLGWFTSGTFAQIAKKDIDKAIDISSLHHPYLYFTEEEKTVLIERIKTDQESKYIFDRLKAECNMLLSMPVDRNIPIQGKNTRADWTEADRDNKYETYYQTNRDNAFQLAFMYQITGDQQYAVKAFEFADAFCDLTTWTMRAHEFPIIYSRIMPWNVPDDQVNFNFDHYNGDAGRMMAAVYDWLYPVLNQKQRDRIRGALLEKVVTRVRGDYEFHWWATAYRCNWCGVCNSGVGLSGLVLLPEHPQLTDIVAESYNRINNMLNELGIDGGWQEGGGYWNYGVHTSTFFADALKRITNSTYNLFENKKLAANPVTFPLYISLPGNRSLNFEDSGGGRTIGSTHLINKLAVETNNKQALWYRNEFFGNGNDIFDIIWPKPQMMGLQPDNPSIHFRTIDWWVMRSDFKDKTKVIVAGKAGKNDDPHHGHLDIGHFIVYWQGEYFIRDLGSGSYDEKYFDQARFDYPQASSVGHNVIFVNGEQQISGKYYKQPYNYDIGGKVLDFKSSEAQDYVLMDPTNAYPKKELKNWRRHIFLEKPDITVVIDEIVTNPAAEIVVRFHPGVDFELKDKYVFLNGKEGNMALIPILSQNFTIRQGKHASHFVNATSTFSWIDYFETAVKSGSEKTILASLIVPVSSAEEAVKISGTSQIVLDNSGKLSLSFSRDGHPYTYNFVKTADGFVLRN